jgi:biopolymer transport protein ExbD
MAEIAEGGGGGHGKGGKKRAKKQSTRVDMTPMVDLAFLLLTFFVLTSTFSKPKSMELSLPVPPDDPNIEQPEVKNGLTFLLTKDDRIFYYAGQFYEEGNKDGKPTTQLLETNFSKDGLHKLLLEKNEWTINEKKRVTNEGVAKKLGALQIAFSIMVIKSRNKNKYNDLFCNMTTVCGSYAVSGFNDKSFVTTMGNRLYLYIFKKRFKEK